MEEEAAYVMHFDLIHRNLRNKRNESAPLLSDDLILYEFGLILISFMKFSPTEGNSWISEYPLEKYPEEHLSNKILPLELL